MRTTRSEETERLILQLASVLFLKCGKSLYPNKGTWGWKVKRLLWHLDRMNEQISNQGSLLINLMSGEGLVGVVSLNVWRDFYRKMKKNVRFLFLNFIYLYLFCYKILSWKRSSWLKPLTLLSNNWPENISICWGNKEDLAFQVFWCKCLGWKVSTRCKCERAESGC